jgi:hypothetical protein
VAKEPRQSDTVWRMIKLNAPARRALVGVGITSFDDLESWSRADVMNLHGIGPNAMGTLTQAMADAGVTFAS